MKFGKIALLSLLTLGSVTLSSCYIDLGFIKIGTKTENDGGGGGNTIIDDKTQNNLISKYYSGLNDNQKGTSLLNALYTLNLSKRKTLTGYSAMGSSSSGKFKFTDFDPNSTIKTVKATIDGISVDVPYGSKVLSFYSGKSTATFNKEHVWPASRLTGGRGNNDLEDDILMPRPTISEENSDRGNSVYVTGMSTSNAGWDPVTAFKNTVGVAQNIRGECARIIFYCMTGDNSLVLNDNTNNSGNNMGKISDLVEWACENPVNDREKRRNLGAQYLQGNRNAFVDHPEYVCKIWGSTNSRTKSACQKANYAY